MWQNRKDPCVAMTTTQEMDMSFPDFSIIWSLYQQYCKQNEEYFQQTSFDGLPMGKTRIPTPCYISVYFCAKMLDQVMSQVLEEIASAIKFCVCGAKQLSIIERPCLIGRLDVVSGDGREHPEGAVRRSA